ncbi:ficolin-2-like [Branchiostoma floridae x Branchiostoma belcheri]
MGIQTSGTYYVGHPQPFQVSCDMDTDGGGWTVIQRRQDGSVAFDNTWDVYVQGFGDVNGALWIGLEHLHSLTSQQQHELYVYLEDWEGNTKFARYGTFSVGDSTSKYTVTISGYIGDSTLSDDLTPTTTRHNINGSMFTTKDQDNDDNSVNCGVTYGAAGWWFPQSCGYTMLNGQYLIGCNPNCASAQGIVWKNWRGYGYSLKKTVMMIRPSGFPASSFNISSCQNGGTMAEITAGTGVYTCTCPPGWESTFCEHDINNECASSPCTHGTCVDDVNSYTCTCETGWAGDNCNTG